MVMTLGVVILEIARVATFLATWEAEPLLARFLLEELRFLLQSWRKTLVLTASIVVSIVCKIYMLCGKMPSSLDLLISPFNVNWVVSWHFLQLSWSSLLIGHVPGEV